MAMIGDRFPAEARQVAISRVTAAGLTGQILSASLAGILAATIGWRAGLFAAGTFALVAAIGATLFIRPITPAAAPTRFRITDAVANYRKMFANPKAILCFTTVFLEGIALFGATPFVTELLERSGSGGPREAGFIIAAIGVGGIAYSAALSSIIRRVRRTSLMAAGGLIAPAGLAGLALELPWPAIAALFALTGVGFMMLHNSIQTEVVELGPRRTLIGVFRARVLVLHGAGAGTDRVCARAARGRRRRDPGRPYLRSGRHRAGRLAAFRSP
jgi:predicted MFS family arabinose efflux permease